jgi:hypothetical protein
MLIRSHVLLSPGGAFQGANPPGLFPHPH